MTGKEKINFFDSVYYYMPEFVLTYKSEYAIWSLDF